MTTTTPTQTLTSCGYSGRRTAELAGITYRQLDYWARTDMIRPSLCDASGSGSRRRYSDEDLVTLSLVRQLLDSGYRLEQVRAILHDLPDDWTAPDQYLVLGRRTVRDVHPDARVAGDVDLDLAWPTTSDRSPCCPSTAWCRPCSSPSLFWAD